MPSEENWETDRKRNSLSTIEEPQLTSLIATVEQLESKSSNLNLKVAEAITDLITDYWLSDIFRAIEIQDSISEYTCLAKRIIERSERLQLPTGPPLNVNATPYQPPQSNVTQPSTVEERQEACVTDPTEAGMDADGENTNITQPSLIPVKINPQSIRRLPKLTLPTFSGNSLTWQTF